MHQTSASLNTKGPSVGVKTIKKKFGRMELSFLVKITPTMIPILEMTFSQSILTVQMMWTLLYLTHGTENDLLYIHMILFLSEIRLLSFELWNSAVGE